MLKQTLKIFSIDESETFAANAFKVLLYYFMIISPLLFFFKHFGFVADDLQLLKSSLENHFPVLIDWNRSQANLYRPVVILSFFLNYLISGCNPYSYYLFNFFVHLFCSFFVFLISYEISGINESKKIILPSFLFGLVFLIIPQNIMNVLWISGRTDLVCALFLFISFYFLIKYLNSGDLLLLFSTIILFVLSCMSKETAMLGNFYFALLVLLLMLKKSKINYKRLILPYLSASALYILFRFFIFSTKAFVGSGFGEKHAPVDLKYFLYGLWSIFSPIGVVDALFIDHYKFFLAFILLLLSIIFLFTFLKLTINFRAKENLLSLIFSVVILTSSLMIYFKAYPQMRLMYVHYPILFIGLAFIIKKIEAKKLFIFIMILAFAGLAIYGDFLVVKRTFIINKFYSNLEQVIPSFDDYKKMKVCFLLTPLARLGESWADPDVELIASMKYDSIPDHRYTKFEKAAYYEGNSFSEPDASINYHVYKSNIMVSENYSGGFVPFPTKKFDHLTLVKNNFDIVPKDFQNYKKGIASKILIKFNPVLNQDSCMVIYFSDTGLKLAGLKNFLESYSHD